MRWSRAVALCVGLFGLSPGTGQAAQTPQWEDLSVSQEIAHRYPGAMVPVWYDVNLDGVREPLWLSYDGVEALVIGDDGQPQMVSVDMPFKFQADGGPEILGAVLDADGDGDEEILVFGFEAGLLEAKTPYKLSLATSSLPTLPGAFVGDVAVGDVNMDGRPDVAVSFGIFALERIERRGFGDRLLLNLGEGRFEWHDIEPQALAFTHGLTFVDMDADGRLDIVESFNSSQLTKLARVLLNRTAPGEFVPSFIIAPYAHDIGSNGMGAAVADINRDGHLDIYNTTVGLDYLCMGTADGTCVDESVSRGLQGEWGTDSMRQQWAPTFVDINADGLLDLLVRHGGTGTSPDSGMGWNLSYSEADLVYVQDESGLLRRTNAPFEPMIGPNGRQLVIGDLEGDGLPDVALGGLLGSAGFWRNKTDVAGNRPLSLHLQGTVSGQPPVGTRVEATCGQQSLSRQFTTGGKMGGSPSSTIFLAFPACDEEASLSVQWPSGARSVHSVPVAQTTLEIEEPVWHWRSEDTPNAVTLDPVLAGSLQACMGSEAATWECCDVADAPCTFPIELQEGERLLARLDDQEIRSLPYGASRWVLSSEPSPPRPGEPVIWRVHHVGDPEQMDPTVSLFVDGTIVGWKDLPSPPSTLSAMAEVPADAKAVELALFPMDIPPSATWTRTTAGIFDTESQIFDAYVYRVTGGVTEHWQGEVYTNFVRGSSLETIFGQAALLAPDGTILDMPKNVIPAGIARMRLSIDWDVASDYESLQLVDLAGVASYEIPIPESLTLEEAAGVLDHVRGGVAKNRFVTGGDVGSAVFTLHDKNGLVLPPEPELVTVEVDGGHVVMEIDSFAGTYNLFAMVASDDEEGLGQVHVRSADGRLLGSFPFYKRPNGNSGVVLSETTALLEPALDSEAPATHSVKIYPVNDYNEFTGPGTIIDLVIDGGAQVADPMMIPGGGLNCMVEADPTATELSVEVWLDGSFLMELTTELQPTAVVEPEPSPGEDVMVADTAEVAEEETVAEPAPGCGGCGAASGGAGTLWLVALALLAIRPRRVVQ